VSEQDTLYEAVRLYGTVCAKSQSRQAIIDATDNLKQAIDRHTTARLEEFAEKLLDDEIIKTAQGQIGVKFVNNAVKKLLARFTDKEKS
jgi:hypothetical protein